MRTDLFQINKCVHIKLSKEVHTELRAKLFRYGISMQEIFVEFARLIVEDSPKGISIVNAFINRKIRKDIDDPFMKLKRPTKKFNDVDCESLYRLINDDEDSEQKEDDSVSGSADQ